MLASVRKQIDQAELLLPGETIIVGVSGGMDSTALLHILWSLNEQYHYGWNLHVVHLNHGFRGDESRQDAKYVEELCKNLSVTCHLFERDVPVYIRQTGMGTQEASRELRYHLFQEVAQSVGASKVALAHHSDDQVETILFRLLRGTRLSGLAGMPLRRWLVPERSEVVRPLLHLYRRDIERYCQEVGLTPREDSSNRSRKYKRNELRLDVLPLLKSINSRFREHVIALSESVQHDERYLITESKRHLSEVLLESHARKMVISIDKFQTCDVALQSRMITLILSYLSSGTEWSSQHVEAVLHMIKRQHPSATLHLPNKLIVKRVYQQIHFMLIEQEPVSRSFCYDVVIPGTTRIVESGIAIHTSFNRPASLWKQLPKTVAVFDADTLHGKMAARNRLPGDRIALFGSCGTKKLKELLIDAKIPKGLRDLLPIFVCGDEVLWIPGVKRSAHAAVGERTTRYLTVEVEFGEDWREVFE